MKPKRNLSGVYLNWVNPATQKKESRCFEDLPRTEQLRVLDKAPQQWKDALVLKLADALNEIGDIYDLEIVGSQVIATPVETDDEND